MAVVVKYIVVRDGVEKMTFTSKKEADAYDKQLDIADNLIELLAGAELSIPEESLDELAFFLAQNAADAITILKGGSPRPDPRPQDQEDEDEDMEDEALDEASEVAAQDEEKPKGKGRSKAA